MFYGCIEFFQRFVIKPKFQIAECKGIVEFRTVRIFLQITFIRFLVFANIHG